MSSGDRGPATRGGVDLARRWLIWWALGAALWLLLDDMTALPELIDGVVAAAIGASFAVLAGGPSAPGTRPLHGAARHAWRPPARMVGDLPLLIAVLARAVTRGDRDPGGLRTVAFRVDDEPQARQRRLALATYAGSVAPATVVVTAGPDGQTLVVHELEPARDRHAVDPKELG